MRPRRPGRLLATLSLVSWLATPAISFGALVHVVSDHHHHDDHRTRELALAATHGHSHELATADHRHPALRDDASAVVSAPAAALVTPRPIAPASGRGVRATLCDRPPPTGSPPPLFYRHCALLL